MRHRGSQLNMTHPLTAHLGQGYLNAALLTDNAAILHPLIFATQTFIVTDRAKNTGTEQAVFFWLKCPVINCFRLFNLTERPRADPFGRGYRNLNLIKALCRLWLAKWVHQIIHITLLPALRVVSPTCGETGPHMPPCVALKFELIFRIMQINIQTK